MKILVTGNMGYIGPCVMAHLRSHRPDATLIGLDIGYFANWLSNSVVFPECRADLQWFRDIRSVSIEILQGVDVVVHLAGISNDPMGNSFEDVTMDVNYRGSIELAKKAKEAGATVFIFASSCSMYGAADDSPRTEMSPLNPLTPYAKSKVFAERDLEPLASKEYTVTSLRFSTACGMSERLRLDLVLNDFVAGAFVSKRIDVLSDGSPWRPLIDVKDMARAIEWAIDRKSTNGGAFLAVNIGSDDRNFQIRDLADAVSRTISDVKVSINKNAQPDKRSYKVSFALFKALAPAHQPEIELVTTIQELYNGLQEMRFNDTNFHNSNYMRLMVLKSLRERGLLDEKLQWAWHKITKN